MKKRVVASQGFRSVDGALNTIAGYEAMNIIRKGLIPCGLPETVYPVGQMGALSNAPSASLRSFRPAYLRVARSYARVWDMTALRIRETWP